MGPSLRLGKVLGIPLAISYSWLFIFALVTLSLSYQFGSAYGQWSAPLRWGVSLVSSLLLFASVLVHELSHSLVALRMGLPVYGITLFIFGGVSQIGREASRPGAEALIAVVGPLASFVLGGAFLAVYWALRNVNEPLAAIAVALGPINIALGVFNLLPGFPLDGGRVFRAAVWGVTGSFDRATRLAAMGGRLVGFGLIVVGVAMVLVQGNVAGGLWLAFIGWFLENAARASYAHFRLQEALRGYTARDLMTTECPAVDGGLSLDELVNLHVLPTGQRCFVVTRDGQPEGLVTLRSVRGLSRDQWSVTPVRQVMVPMGQVQAVAPDQDAYAVLEVMDRADVNQVPVLAGGQLLGLITRDRVLHLVRARAELE